MHFEEETNHGDPAGEGNEAGVAPGVDAAGDAGFLEDVEDYCEDLGMMSEGIWELRGEGVRMI